MDNIDWGHLLFSFDGRINRARFWLGVAVVYVAVWLLAILAVAMSSSFMWMVLGIVSIATIWPMLAIQIKRWHDRGKSGWWVLIGFIPLIGGIWVLVECGFLEGTIGNNEYGPNPLEV